MSKLTEAQRKRIVALLKPRVTLKPYQMILGKQLPPEVTIEMGAGAYSRVKFMDWLECSVLPHMYAKGAAKPRVILDFG